MHIDDKKFDDFNLDSISDGDSDFENLFNEPSEGGKPAVKNKAGNEQNLINKDSAYKELGKKPVPAKKRTISDFEPDMDALLMTAQSSMIIEGMELFENKNFASETLQIYLEAVKGVDLYIKILNRNPNNYRKLKSLIDVDIDCQQVEKIAFDLYKKEYDTTPDTDREKLEAFELFKKIFKQSVNKASISKSMKLLRKYFLLSGGLDVEKIQEQINVDSIEIKKDINYFHQHLKIALNMIKKDEGEITRGLRGRDLNVFITKASEFLGYYYKLLENIKVSDYYFRIHNIYKKYFIMKG
ncbi:MAG: hypothetical protein JXN64_04545 [Spirochaetes bacterium]|nr:hypothetical protein [Spirochaetota bacterium]